MYIQTWQKLICYFYCVTDGKCLYKDLFQPIERQLKYTSNIMEVANEVKLREEQDKKEDKKKGKIGTKEAIKKLNKLVLKLNLTFI